MQKELIYKKCFPKENIEDLLANVTSQEDTENRAPTFRNPEELLAWAYKGVEYKYLPRREKTATALIKIAKETAEQFEIDTTIWRFSDHITVEYCFDCAGAIGFLKESLVYADDISFFKDIDGYDIIMHIDHYTHAVYRNGKRRKP